MIVDSSAIMAILLNEPAKPVVERLLDAAERRAAASLQFEVGNGLTRGLKQKRLTAEQAVAIVEDFELLRPAFELVEVPLRRAIEIAGRFRIYAYDAYVLAVAESTREELLTLDGPMATIARQMGLAVVEVE